MATKIQSVLLLDGIDKVCSSRLLAAGITTTTEAKLTKEQLIVELEKHDAVVVRSATKMTADVLASCNRLKVVGRAGTGVDNIDLEAATKKGILVMNTPGGNTLSAAEHTCALICSLSRSIPQACASLKEGAWNRKLFLGNELGGKVLGIIGLGRIGREVAHRMQSFGMKTVGYDPMVSKEDAAACGIEFLELEEIWPIVDYITVHTPLIKQTRNLINEETYQKTKSTVKIVNVARGGIVDEQALLKALQNGTCGGAALDVYETEPPTDFTLIKHPLVIATPHLGANTKEAQTRVAEEIADQFIEMSLGKPLQGVVNVPALTFAGSPIAKPWIELASSLASLASQVDSVVEEPMTIEIDLKGEEVCMWKNVIVPAVQRGFLQKTKKNVNLVNAKILAQEAGLDVVVKQCPEVSEKSVGSSLQLTLSVNGEIKAVLEGYLSNNKPSLRSWNDSIWENGVLLQGSLTFIETSPSKDVRKILEGDECQTILTLLFSSGNISIIRTKNGFALKTDNSVIAKIIF